MARASTPIVRDDLRESLRLLQDGSKQEDDKTQSCGTISAPGDTPTLLPGQQPTSVNPADGVPRGFCVHNLSLTPVAQRAPPPYPRRHGPS